MQNSHRTDEKYRPRLLPELSCDCHIHILGPDTHYNFVADRQYTPMNALVPEAMHMLSALGCIRAVVIQPSVYGTDNSCTLDAMEKFPIATRSVIVIPKDISQKTLVEWHQAGVRGIRLNGPHWTSEELEQRFSAFEKQFGQMRELNWHIECHVNTQTHQTLLRIADRSNVNIVLDHFGGPFQTDESIDERINSLDRILNTGRIWTKLSGIYRLKKQKGDNSQYLPLIRHLVNHHSERLIWGSDWPHTPDRQNRENYRSKRLPFQKIDTYGFLESLLEQIPDHRVRERIFVKNPETIYQF